MKYALGYARSVLNTLATLTLAFNTIEMICQNQHCEK